MTTRDWTPAGVSLASPLSNGVARQFRGATGIYGVVDQQIYRPVDGGPDSGVGIFSRISASPSDSSHINFFFDGGIVCLRHDPEPPQ